MAKCICIDDTFKPETFPSSKWIKAGHIYTVIYTVTVLPQGQLAFQLDEIDLDESCYPYEYFLANRFAFNHKELMNLMDIIEASESTDLTLSELLQQTNLVGA
jgi:hypothetical protein